MELNYREIAQAMDNKKILVMSAQEFKDLLDKRNDKEILEMEKIIMNLITESCINIKKSHLPFNYFDSFVRRNVRQIRWGDTCYLKIMLLIMLGNNEQDPNFLDNQECFLIWQERYKKALNFTNESEIQIKNDDENGINGTEINQTKPLSNNDFSTLPEEENKNITKIKDFTFEHDSHIVNFNNTSIKLTKIDFKILFILITSTDEIITFKQISETVWPDNNQNNNHLIQTHISIIRKKMAATGLEIVSINTVGFKIPYITNLYARATEVINNVTFYQVTFEIEIDGRLIKLSKKQFLVFKYLVSNSEKAVSINEIRANTSISSANSIRNYLHALKTVFRDKIQNLHGIGYKYTNLQEKSTKKISEKGPQTLSSGNLGKNPTTGIPTINKSELDAIRERLKTTLKNEIELDKQLDAALIAGNQELEELLNQKATLDAQINEHALKMSRTLARCLRRNE